MKKDILVAVSGGIVLGIIIAVSVVNLPNLATGLKIPSLPKPVSPTPSQMAEIAKNLDITVDMPKDESVASGKTVEISGIGSGTKFILVESENEQIVLTTEDSGKFKGKLSLSEGANAYFLTGFDNDGNSISKTLTVYYTSEEL